MTVSNQVQDYLRRQSADFDVLPHPHAASGMRVAEAAHIAGDCLAKGVLMEDEDGLVLALVPATHRVRVGAVRRHLERPVGLATEQEAAAVFRDCEPGAVPSMGAPYGLRTLADEALFGRSDIYLEGGDHRELLHMKGKTFDRLLKAAKCGVISRHI